MIKKSGGDHASVCAIAHVDLQDDALNVTLIGIKTAVHGSDAETMVPQFAVETENVEEGTEDP